MAACPDHRPCGSENARGQGVTLLTNGKVLAPETKDFLAAHPKVKVTAIGEHAAAMNAASSALTGRDGAELSLKVARKYFATKSPLGVATSVDFADALIGGAQIGQEGGVLVLTNGRNATRVNAYVKSTDTVDKLYVYGGSERIGVASE